MNLFTIVLFRLHNYTLVGVKATSVAYSTSLNELTVSRNNYVDDAKPGFIYHPSLLKRQKFLRVCIMYLCKELVYLEFVPSRWIIS